MQQYHDLYTTEGETLTGQPWNVYPRPQMRRDSFFCLNGEWEFSCGEKMEMIRVPYPPESLLSGIHRYMGTHPKLYYRKTFTLPADFLKERVILHFGAVDQCAEVALNGVKIGSHRGGYEAFSFDVTEALREKENVLEVYVTDELSNKILPYGKQCEKRGGMWYTPVSGIWQTVWMESVCARYMTALHIQNGEDYAEITADGANGGEITVMTPDGERCISFDGNRVRVNLEHPRMWSPEDPYLYEFVLRSGEDEVHSYFALRTLETKEIGGIPRLCLNGEPYFFHALLDQGYYSDGIFTPAAPISFEKDILIAKSLGFNTLRKHIKIEPETFYYDCDRLGMIVFQDMVNNGSYSFLRDTALPTIGMKRFPDWLLHRNRQTRQAFEDGMRSTVCQLKNHPCICYWTIFNEGWGQFESGRMYRLLKSLDDTRFLDTASGWFSGAESDVESLHIYFKPVKTGSLKKKLPAVLSEFGGYSYRVADHLFNSEKNYGYRFFEKREAFENALVKLYREEIIPAVKAGICGAVYTQLSDVEDETNGLLTYDRKVLKVDAGVMRQIAEELQTAVRM